MKTINETLTSRIQKFEEDEPKNIKLKSEIEEYKKQIDELIQDNERLRGERKTYREENHKLIKKILDSEEAYRQLEKTSDEKLRNLAFQLAEAESNSPVELFEQKLGKKTAQLKAMGQRLKAMEHQGRWEVNHSGGVGEGERGAKKGSSGGEIFKGR